MLLAELGFANVSTRLVAERAGLSRSHIYHYFKDWPSLRREAFGRFAREQFSEFNGTVVPLPPVQALEALVDYCIPDTADAGWALYHDAWDEAFRDPQLANDYRSINECWTTLLTSIVETGVRQEIYSCSDPAKAARQILAMIAGYVEELLLEPSIEAAELAQGQILEAAWILTGRSRGSSSGQADGGIDD